MEKNFRSALALVLKDEGVWANHPKDPGGATMRGVTLDTFRRYIKPGGTEADLRAITDEQLAVVYKRQYWAKVMGADLPSGVDYAVFDFAVNSGPDRAARYLQAVVNVPQDGAIGPATLAAVKAHDPQTVIAGLNQARLSFLRKLSTWPTFGKGWLARVKSVDAEAKRMAAEPDETPATIQRFIPEIVAAEVPGLDKPLIQSSTAWSSLAQTGLGGLSAFAAFDWKVAMPIVVIGGMLAFWIIYQRMQYASKAREAVASATAAP